MEKKTKNTKSLFIEVLKTINLEQPDKLIT